MQERDQAAEPLRYRSPGQPVQPHRERPRSPRRHHHQVQRREHRPAAERDDEVYFIVLHQGRVRSYGPDEIIEVAEVLAKGDDSTLSEEALPSCVLRPTTFVYGRRASTPSKPRWTVRGNGRYPTNWSRPASRRADLRPGALVDFDTLRGRRLGVADRTARRMATAIVGRAPFEHQRLGRRGWLRLTTRSRSAAALSCSVASSTPSVAGYPHVRRPAAVLQPGGVGRRRFRFMLVYLGASCWRTSVSASMGEDSLFVDRTTNQLYVVMPGSRLLRAVYNFERPRGFDPSGNPGPNTVKLYEKIEPHCRRQAVRRSWARAYATPSGWRQIRCRRCTTS